MDNYNYGDGWNTDKLQRLDEANFLTEYLVGKSKLEQGELNDGSFVLNINAEWGFGKTYFLRNWADDLAAKGHPVVYFDAWQNDFSKEPLIAFISTINSQLEPYFNRKIGEKRGTRVKHILEEWYATGKKLLAPSSPFVLGVLAKKLAGMSMEEFSQFFEEDMEEHRPDEIINDKDDDREEFKQAVSTVVSKAASKMLASHNSTKKTIFEFKNNLGKLTSHLESLKTINTPIFIFVDELDRCRPNYAIELLENIKHLFGVPKVFFVVATASDQLCHSIKKVYGQDFDSPNYLKRFFDQTYTLNEPDRHSFAEYLFEKFDLANRDNLFPALEDSLFAKKNTNAEAFAFMSNAFNIGLRDMIQYCVIIDSVCLTFKEAPVHLIYIFFLIRLRDIRKDLYSSFVSGEPIEEKDLFKLSSNIKKTVATYEQKGSFSQSPTKITAYTLIKEYISLSKMSLHDISRNYNSEAGYTIITSIQDTLLKEVPRTYPIGSAPKHKLYLYPKLIEQAGRLT